MSDNSFFRGRSVLVTGASGFIGSHLCRRLTGLGAKVHGVSREKREDGTVSRWWQADLENETATRQIVEDIKPDFIFHLASFVSGGRDLGFVLPALRSNLLSTVNLLVCATEIHCSRVVLTGSLEEPEGDFESAMPASPYAAAKGAASLYARMFHSLYGTSVVTARLFMVYGPDQKDRSKLIPYVTLSLLREEIPKLMSGTREVDWIYVDDVVDAYLALAKVQGVDGETIDVGSGQLISVRHIVDTLSDIVGARAKPKFGSVKDRPFERVRLANVGHSYRLTGWKPKIVIKDGLQKTVEWYRENQ